VIASLFARHRIVAAFLAAIFVLTLAAGSASAIDIGLDDRRNASAVRADFDD
jgi:hypothetical protein